MRAIHRRMTTTTLRRLSLHAYAKQVCIFVRCRTCPAYNYQRKNSHTHTHDKRDQMEFLITVCARARRQHMHSVRNIQFVCPADVCLLSIYYIYIWYIRYNIATAQHTKHICFCLRNRPAKPLVTGAKKFVWQQLLRARSQFFHSYAHTAIKSAMPRHRGGSAAPTYPLLGLNAIKCAAKDTF